MNDYDEEENESAKPAIDVRDDEEAELDLFAHFIVIV